MKFDSDPNFSQSADGKAAARVWGRMVFDFLLVDPVARAV
jgi:hypothetical protein